LNFPVGVEGRAAQRRKQHPGKFKAERYRSYSLDMVTKRELEIRSHSERFSDAGTKLQRRVKLAENKLKSVLKKRKRKFKEIMI